MTARGYPAEFAERCFNQIKGFGEYGFPESHAASFAHLVYVSAWIKCHYPAAFAAALLNSQPMGFYAPAQIVRCAREHGVEAREADVNHSLWDCTLEPVSRCRATNSPSRYRLAMRQMRPGGARTMCSVSAPRPEGIASQISIREVCSGCAARLSRSSRHAADRRLARGRREAPRSSVARHQPTQCSSVRASA